jgi:CheY-like chemotaxis protein
MARILVIDDDEPVGDTVRTMLVSGGHDVVLAAGVDDGVRLFRDQRFDLVICDLFMPTKEIGLETIAALRAISASTPIVSMTGSVPMAPDGKPRDADLIHAAGQLGPIRMVGKPFRARELLEVVRQCLSSAAAWCMAHHLLWM